jgi:hypothetical protein
MRLSREVIHETSNRTALLRQRGRSISRHPLHDLVVQIMASDQCQDATKLGVALSGCTLSGKSGVSGNRAYRLVASDVLGCMYEQGYLDRDESGWYVLPSEVATDDQRGSFTPLSRQAITEVLDS